MPTNKIAFINGKGGCGKTTSIYHIAGILANQNERVLVIDFDKQRNLSDIMLRFNAPLKHSIFDFMIGKTTPNNVTGRAFFKKTSAIYL